MSQPQEQHPTPAAPGAPTFLDVPMLLERSRPRTRHGWLLPAVAVLIVLILGSTYLSGRSPAMKQLVDAASGLGMIVIAGAMATLMWNAVRRQREERTLLETVEEMV